jgi:ABC-type phosphate transport system substrate-binding protein
MIMKARAQTASAFQVSGDLECGPAKEVISIAGSTTTYPIASLFGTIYGIGCDVEVKVEGGSSTVGAIRLCGGGDGPVDIGTMSREWKSSEGLQEGHNVYCTTFDTSRSSIQIPVAYSAIVLATASGGPAKQCIDSLGGLTPDQLRWIFSSYNEKELEAAGWSPNSISNPDYDESTHLWSELSSDCEATEILLGGANDLTDIYYDFKDAILTDHRNGEIIATDRLNGYVSGATDSSTVSFLLENGAALAFFGINYYEKSSDSLNIVPIQNYAGAFVLPDDSLIQSRAYDILSKPLYMNVNNDIETLPSTVPLVRFGMSDDGTNLVAAAGYVPIADAQRQEILSMLCLVEGAPASGACTHVHVVHTDNGMKPGTMKPGGIAGIVILVVAVVAVAAAVVVRKYNTRKEVDSGDSNASPYATSRTNWASQEPEMETPIEDFAAKDVDDSEDKPGPQLV